MGRKKTKIDGAAAGNGKEPRKKKAAVSAKTEVTAVPDDGLETAATAAPLDVAVVPVEMIRVASVRPSPANPRDFAGKDQYIRELADNIRAVGLMSPVTVRRTNADTWGRFLELVAGECRWRAFKLLGQKEMPAFVRELTDDQAYQLTVTENMQREDLSPIEEARGIKTLIDTGQDMRVIADNLGKPVSWVYRRAKLQDLSPKWKTAIADPTTTVAQFSASHLELVARLDRKYQDEVLNNYAHHFRVPSIKDLSEEIDRYLLRLKKAPWKLDESDDCGGPACAACFNRSSACPDLFDDVMKSADDDRCLDRRCYGEKMKRYIRRRQVELTKKHGKLILIDRGDYSNRIFAPDDDIKNAARRDYQVETAKKGAKDARPALVVDGPGAGELRWVKDLYDRSSNSTARQEGPKTLKERRRILKGKRDKALIEQLIKILEAEIETPSWSMLITPDDVIPAVYLVLLAQTNYDDPDDWWKRYEKERGRYAEGPKAYATSLLVEVIRINWRKHLGGSLNKTLDRIDGAFARGVGKYLGIDIEALDRQIAESIPEPKAWALLNEDGTPKKQAELGSRRSVKKDKV